VRVRRVQLDYCFTAKKAVCKQGLTNSEGVFVFLFEQPVGWVHAFVSVAALGYRGRDERLGLTEEKVISPSPNSPPA
jgi:hypothetical protein